MMPEGILIADARGAIVQHNAAATRFLGDDLTGQIERLVSDSLFLSNARDSFPPQEMQLARVLAGNGSRVAEVYLRPAGRSDGTWVSMEVRPLTGINSRTKGALILIRDLTAYKTLRESEILYHSLLENLPFSVFRKDQEGRYIYANRRFCDTLGKAVADIVGKVDRDLFSPELAEKYRRDDLQILESGQVLEDIEEHTTLGCWPRCRCSMPAEASLVPMQVSNTDRFSGGHRFVHCLLAPVRNTAGQVIGTQGAFWNVTARMRAERRLEEALTQLERSNAELQRSNAELELFAYVASHDLKEPLRMVSSFTQLLQHRYGARLGAEGDEFIGYAVDGATRLHQLIDDLLAYSRVENKGGALEEIDCTVPFQTAIANLQAVIEESNAQVTCDPLPRVRGAETQLTQLFQNLISNGIKFRRPETPHIRIRVRATKSAWHFSIRDNGIGIEPEHLESIFVLFKRLHTREEYPGTGLGLAICKKIVERHGGRIWAESIPGRGTSFHFTMPRIGGLADRVKVSGLVPPGGRQ
jgi:PAS domain S-box-containing protein